VRVNKSVVAEQYTVCLHVDDWMITCRQDATIEALLAELTVHFWQSAFLPWHDMGFYRGAQSQGDYGRLR